MLCETIMNVAIKAYGVGMSDEAVAKMSCKKLYLIGSSGLIFDVRSGFKTLVFTRAKRPVQTCSQPYLKNLGLKSTCSTVQSSVCCLAKSAPRKY